MRETRRTSRSRRRGERSRGTRYGTTTSSSCRTLTRHMALAVPERLCRASAACCDRLVIRGTIDGGAGKRAWNNEKRFSPSIKVMGFRSRREVGASYSALEERPAGRLKAQPVPRCRGIGRSAVFGPQPPQSSLAQGSRLGTTMGPLSYDAVAFRAAYQR